MQTKFNSHSTSVIQRRLFSITMENSGVIKLVGARKRKPISISKIPSSSIYSEPQDLTSSHSDGDGNRSKLNIILDELRVKKSLQSSPTMLHMAPASLPSPPMYQTEPLDLSMDAVDLSKSKLHPTTTATPAQMMAFYQNYLNNQTSTRDKITRESYCGGGAGMETDHPFDLDDVSMVNKAKIGCHGDSGRYNVCEEMGVGVVANKGGIEERTHSKKKGGENKPKQRRYRTERPFACPHCSARFTLRSNMERHGKHQHPTVWQRSPSNRVLNKRKLLSGQPSPISVSSPESQQSQVRGLLSNKLKRKLSENSVDKMENNSDQLASVGELLKLGLWKEEDQVSDKEEEEEQESGEESGSEGEEIFKQSAYSSAPHKVDRFY